MSSPITFPHRHNPDGTYDSICTQCFATVATAPEQSALLAHEVAHICAAANLYRITPCRVQNPIEARLNSERRLSLNVYVGKAALAVPTGQTAVAVQ